MVNAPMMDRRAAVQRLMDTRDEALVVTGLGSPSYDVHAAGDHEANYYLWGAMGGAALVGLGLALAQPTRRVMVVTGDGEQLMAFGSMATIAVAKPSNLEVFVLDNEHYGETGMRARASISRPLLLHAASPIPPSFIRWARWMLSRGASLTNPQQVLVCTC